MKELTPIAEAIEELKKSISQETEVLESPSKYHPNDVFQARSFVNSVKRQIEILTKYLPKEQAAIEQTWNDCNEWKWRAAPTPTATQYFTNRYKGNE